jgi:hypothetical protein
MADVRLDVEKVVPAGLVATYNGSLSISDEYLVKNSGRTFLHFKKSGAGDCDVTIQTPVTVDGLTVEEQVVTIPATTGDKFLGPFPTRIYNDSSGDLRFTCDDITGLTVAVLRI